MGWQPAMEKTTFRLRISICVAFVSLCAVLRGADRLFGGTGCGDIEEDAGDNILSRGDGTEILSLRYSAMAMAYEPLRCTK